MISLIFLFFLSNFIASFAIFKSYLSLISTSENGKSLKINFTFFPILFPFLHKKDLEAITEFAQKELKQFVEMCTLSSKVKLS